MRALERTKRPRDARRLVQTRPFGRLQHRRQTRARHEVRIIEDGVEALADSHLPGCPSVVAKGSLDKIDSPATAGHFGVTTRAGPQLLGGSGLSPGRFQQVARRAVTESTKQREGFASWPAGMIVATVPAPQ